MTDLKAKLISKLKAPACSPSSGGFLSPHLNLDLQSNRQAAVLVACVDSANPSVVLTVRAQQVPHHAGQVSLPGGRHHADETFPVATALREAREEIGLAVEEVELLGCLDPVRTSTGFDVVPVVGWVSKRVSFVPCEREVSAVFELPLAHVLDPQNYSTHRFVLGRGTHSESTHRLWRLRATQWPVWGATAQVLAQLAGLSVDAPSK